ncbi:MAG: hypothetical protein ACR2KT_12875 [Methylocella sp.]
MLATARRNRIGDFGWAAISGFVASLPATAHDLIKAYLIDNPIGLSATRLLDVAVTIFFLALIVGALLRDRGQSSHQLLQDILNPTTAHNTSKDS